MANGNLNSTAYRLLMAALVACSVLLFGAGQQTSLTKPEKPTTATTDSTSAENDQPILSTPRVALETFLKANSDSNPDTDLALAILPLNGPSTNPAVLDRLSNSIFTILTYLGWTTETVKEYVPDNDFKGDTWQVFPFEDKSAKGLYELSNSLMRASGGRYSLVLQRDNTTGFRFTNSSINLDSIDGLASAVEKLRRQSGVTTYTSLSDWMSINAPSSMLKRYFFLRTWQWGRAGNRAVPWVRG